VKRGDPPFLEKKKNVGGCDPLNSSKGKAWGGMDNPNCWCQKKKVERNFTGGVQTGFEKKKKKIKER